VGGRFVALGVYRVGNILIQKLPGLYLLSFGTTYTGFALGTGGNTKSAGMFLAVLAAFKGVGFGLQLQESKC
jgi:hypothetical protein